MSARQCPYCGTWVPEGFANCQKCREPVAQVYRGPMADEKSKRQIRRGLMYMWVAGLVYYLVKGYAVPLHLPTTYTPYLTEYILPFMFLGGLGLIALGLLRRVRG